MRMSPLPLLPLLLQASLAHAGATVHGNAPLAQYPRLEAKIDETWQYQKGKYLGGRSVPDPEIYFFSFVRAEESPEWVEWQNGWIGENPQIWLDWTKVSGKSVPAVVTKEWLAQHPDLFPFPKTFRAFHYDGTNRIQIDPQTTFLPFYVNDPYGVKSDQIGFGFYTAAHELMHYTLERRGIPGRVHHCLFVAPREGKLTLMQDAAQFLVDRKISNPYVRFMGADKEQDFGPCSALTPDEKALVGRYAEELP